MWSVEVGIQRRREGHLDFFLHVVVAVAEEVISSAMVANDLDTDDLDLNQLKR
jgi:hypothetical protein